MLPFACSTKHSPLTLTLSLREREQQQASDWCLADGRWANSDKAMIQRRWTILPLLRGEGRGEGKSVVRLGTRDRLALIVRSLPERQHAFEPFIAANLRRQGLPTASPAERAV